MEQIKPRVLIFVIAYQAEDTLRSVLDRIPAEVFERYECEVLVVDDASADDTISIAHDYARSAKDVPLTVLQNGVNQGYGGNQKVGYTYAIRHAFDVVVMVHGDGQYAPEELPRMIAPVAEDRADAVFGSRMMNRFGALRGGMPLYKYVGNKVLTTAQNALLRTRLSEFHSGYRAYRVEALAATPFLLNSDDFHFDTEIIIQLLHGGRRIEEIPIPTYYGDEICRVDGMKYAKNVMIATVESALHRSGLLYQRRFDPQPADDNDHYDLKLGYTSSHQLAIDSIPEGARVVDLGSGPGGVATELARKGCEVTVVDRVAPKEVPEGVDVVVQDLDDDLEVDLEPYSHVLLLDIIEHLRDPEKFMEELREHFSFDDKRVVLTTGNVAFVIPRLMLLAGQFNYGKAGILDRTHTRLFTFRSLIQLFEDAGLEIEEVRGIPAPIPKAIGDGVLSRALLRANEAMIDLSPSLFSYQIMVVAKSKPSVRYVLEDAMERVVASEAANEARTPSP
jgi:glycosyltransferase involved in cell wall biosynthesis/2-polyprenyl-3-methyl-5-hydroxy-6-metoxy-1,4-benzoquinol methylase